MVVRPTSIRLFSGMLTPAIRAIELAGAPSCLAPCLTLPLLVPRVLADHQNHATPANDLALLTHRLHRCSYLHGTRFAVEEGPPGPRRRAGEVQAERPGGRSLSQRGRARPA